MLVLGGRAVSYERGTPVSLSLSPPCLPSAHAPSLLSPSLPPLTVAPSAHGRRRFAGVCYDPSRLTPPASEQRVNNVKGFQDLYLKAKARIWPRLCYVCRVRSTVAVSISLSLPPTDHSPAWSHLTVSPALLSLRRPFFARPPSTRPRPPSHPPPTLPRHPSASHFPSRPYSTARLSRVGGGSFL